MLQQSVWLKQHDDKNMAWGQEKLDKTAADRLDKNKNKLKKTVQEAPLF